MNSNGSEIAIPYAIVSRLGHASARVEQALRSRTRVVCEAKQAGLSVRQIAAACGLSPSRVQRLLAGGAVDAQAPGVIGGTSGATRGAAALLRRLTLFDGIGDIALNLLAERVLLKSFTRRTILIHEGDNASTLYVILSGNVEVYANDPNGKEVILGALDAGDCVGELALLDDRPRCASVRTVSACQMLALTRAAFMEIVEDHAGVALELLTVLAGKLREQTASTRDLVLKSAYQRLVAALYALGEQVGDEVIIPYVTHQQLANRIHASREMVTRLINDLKTGGYIQVGQRRIVFKKRLPACW